MTQCRDTLFSQACRARERTGERFAAWMMRQAGRYQPEYMALKQRVGGFWNLCQDSDAIAEATLFAQKSLGADAAIIFSDITLPAAAMGLPLRFDPGPIFEAPVRNPKDLKQLHDYDAALSRALIEGIQKTRQGLNDDISLIGFVGAPLTMASYMIEGKPDKHWSRFKTAVYAQPTLMEELLERLVDVLCEHALLQVDAGCDAIQIFDSSAGEVAVAELHNYGFGAAKGLIGRIRERTDVPVIYFARGVGAQISALKDVGADVIGVDWTLTLSQAAELLDVRETGISLQGNLDPLVLYGDDESVHRRTQRLLDEAKTLPCGYVFNLGHGILPQTPPENAKRVFDLVREYRL